MARASDAADPRRRYALVGTGHRAEMYFAALLKEHRDVGVLVALCDVNRTRMRYYQDAFGGICDGAVLPAYGADQFVPMMVQERPDVVVVTTMDSTHAGIVSAALDRGCDVVCEKPLTVDADGCRIVADAAERNDGELILTFNYRYSPRNSMVKRLLSDGAIGQVTSVTFEWLLDTVHGADYFRRWHRSKANSGGLLVHKASHHFDLVNWWLDDVPDTVFALGSLGFYGPDNPEGRRRAAEGPPDRSEDPFALDLDDSPRLAALYGKAREEDGYIRDQDVFSAGIDIEDNMAVLVGYEGGPSLTYALNAHSPWEGYRVAFNGTEGRLELSVCERAEVLPEAAGEVVGRPRKPAVDPSVDPQHQVSAEQNAARRPGTELVLQRHWSAAERVDVPEGAGAHGGGDERLLNDTFRGVADDPLHHRAGYRDGIRSVLIGVAANRSISTRNVVRIEDLGVERRAYVD